MNKRRSKADWQQLVDERMGGGLARKAFCAQAGIAVATFGYWKRTLRADGTIRSGDPVSARGVSPDEAHKSVSETVNLTQTVASLSEQLDQILQLGDCSGQALSQ
ncbi:MAG TPA: hypothetical protein ENI96_08890 [Sedimenticola thiotaurini]|uniref:Transposase n=1 Tax=Sedimenticola thiotaurini TaxID=1543721 RepID=A0A831W7H4_9GAMM|nr:hypothetical protein [Sedimenticola thiotaurini]